MAIVTKSDLPQSMQQVINPVDPSINQAFTQLASYVFSGVNDATEIMRYINTVKDGATRAAFTATVKCQQGIMASVDRDRYIEALRDDRLRRAFKTLFDVSLSQTPSLRLDFSQPLPSSVTFTRASTATYFGSDGLLKTAPLNLLTYSEQFDNAAWVKSNATVTDNATTAPDGTLTADKLVESAINGVHIAEAVLSTSTGSNYTFSVYAKAGEDGYVGLYDNNAGKGAFFNLTTGQFSSNIVSAPLAYSVVSSGNGWYRCSVTFASTGTTTCRIFTSKDGSTFSYTGDGTSGIYIWGAQLETGTVANQYVKTLATQDSAPRIEYDPVTKVCKGLLIEEQRTNLLTYSESFDNAAWGKNFTTVTANAAIAPDGTTTADSIAKSVAYGYVFQQVATAAGVSYSASVYAKAGTESKVTLLLGESNFGTVISRGYVDLTTGTITNVNGVGLSVVSVGNGWWKISTAGTTSAAVNIGVAVYPGIYSGSETGTVYIWGAQLEAGAFATSYIPTTSAQATRVADVASMTGTNFSSWFNASEGTVVTAFATPDNNATKLLYRIGDSANKPGSVGPYVFTSQIVLDKNSIGSLATNYSINPLGAANAFAYSGTSFAMCTSGGTVATATSSFPVPTNAISLGSEFSPVGNMINGHIRSITYYAKRLPNATLQALTA